jgi:hypothetical protein
MKKEINVIDKFGFMPKKWSLFFDEYEIIPVDDYDEVKKCIDEYTNKDGFYYPPLVHTVKLDPITGEPKEKISKTERSAHLYPLLPSHVIKIKRTIKPLEQLRKGPTGFIIHLLGYLFGRRFQFYDWWFDGRIPMRNPHNLLFTEKDMQDFARHSFSKWKIWQSDKQKLFTNLLFMHSRAISYEWDWERFMIEYTVFDGCWNFYSGGNINYSHSGRLKKILSDLGMKIYEDKIERIVKLRKDLFHETLWDKGQPCSAGDAEAFTSYYDLMRINQRLFVALLEYSTDYIYTDWRCLGLCSLKS